MYPTEPYKQRKTKKNTDPWNLRDGFIQISEVCDWSIHTSQRHAEKLLKFAKFLGMSQK